MLGATAVAPAGTTVVLEASKDNSIFEDFEDNSNGMGDRIYAGVAGLNTVPIGAFRRGLVAFDVAGNIPAGAAIVSAKLSLTSVQTAPDSGATDFFLHRLSANWGEGASDSGPSGKGVAAAPGDATWTQNFFGTSPWTTNGGDFLAVKSATATVGAANGTYDWTGAQLTADVQDFLDNPGTNFGWILSGDEGGLQNARAFASQQFATVASRPKLTVEFTSSDPEPIVITGVRIEAGNFLATFTAEGNVDAYRSTDLQDFGAAPVASDLAPGTDVVLEAVSLPEAFYVLVPTGGPAP
ncbi:MAG: DNRLRE domain-containing protein [Akkermansiaceae bacterium]|nr:DNRLRE domain-containing protein [Akkermansiaceae bacterium]